MNLNLLTLFAPPAQNQAPAVGGSNVMPPLGAPKIGANIGDLMFGQLLVAQLRTPQVKAALQNVTANVTQAGQLGDQRQIQQLKATIAQLLQNGTTLEQVVNQLAQTLGSNFLSKLQTQLGASPGTDAQTTINLLIAQALGPPANGPPQPAPQVAAALVERLMEVADTLAAVSGSDNAAGQQHESLGKTVSDAKARDDPAPKTSTPAILQVVLAALQPYLAAPLGQTSPASSSSGSNAPNANPIAGPPAGNSPTYSSAVTVAQAPIQPPAPWVPTTVSSTGHATAAPAATPSGNATTATAQVVAQSSGGPTVAANPVLTLVGTGGDSVIGRILARAANVAANQATAQSDSSQAGTATLQPEVAIAPPAAASNGTAGDALLASMLRTLQTAFAPVATQKPDSAQADSGSTLAPLATTTAPSTSSVFASLGLGPVVSTTVDSNAASTAPNQSMQTPAYVDPNGIVDQVLTGITMRYQPDGTQTVRMRLVPESLGDVTVNLQVQNGSVTATLLAQNTDVRDALLANQQTLMRSLADAGLKLSSFTVNLANGGLQYQQPQYSNTPQFGTTRRYLGNRSEGADDAVAAVPTFGPPQTQLAALQWLNALA